MAQENKTVTIPMSAIVIFFLIMLGVSVSFMVNVNPWSERNTNLTVKEDLSFLGVLYGDKVGYVEIKEKGRTKPYVYYRYTTGDTKGLSSFLNECGKPPFVYYKECVVKGVDGNFYRYYKDLPIANSSLSTIHVDILNENIVIDKESKIEGTVVHEDKAILQDYTPKDEKELYRYAIELVNDLNNLYYTTGTEEELKKGYIKEHEIPKVLEVEEALKEGEKDFYYLDSLVDDLFAYDTNSYVRKVDLYLSKYGDISNSTVFYENYYNNIKDILDNYVKKAYDLTDSDLEEIYKLGENKVYKGVQYSKLLPEVLIPFEGKDLTLYNIDKEINKMSKDFNSTSTSLKKKIQKYEEEKRERDKRIEEYRDKLENGDPDKVKM